MLWIIRGHALFAPEVCILKRFGIQFFSSVATISSRVPIFLYTDPLINFKMPPPGVKVTVSI